MVWNRDHIIDGRVLQGKGWGKMAEAMSVNMREEAGRRKMGGGHGAVSYIARQLAFLETMLSGSSA